MEIKVNKAENNTFRVDITIPAEDMNKAIDEAYHHEGENVEIKGFRKGKAPLKVLKDHIDSNKVRNHALNHILPDVFSRVIKENKINPIVQPRFEIKEFEEGKDLKLVMVLIERPTMQFKGYKEALKAIGKKKKADEEITNEEIVKTILENSTIGIPTELIDEEVQRMMSSLIDQTAKLGLTIDQYLESQKKKIEDIRKEYKDVAERTIKADFLVTEIGFEEGVKVDDAEIDATIAAIPDAKSREALSQPDQKLYIKAVLLKNKTLQHLAKLAKSEEKEVKKEKENGSKKK